VLLPPPAAFARFRSLTTLNLDYVIFSGEMGWERLEAIILTAVPTLEKLRPTDIAFYHAAPDKGLPVPSSSSG
jgi:hypothetical protein